MLEIFIILLLTPYLLLALYLQFSKQLIFKQLGSRNLNNDIKSTINIKSRKPH